MAGKIFENCLRVLMVLIFPCCVLAQATSGATGILDTSFTLNSELLKLRKHHPFITPVVAGTSVGVRQEKDLVYCEDGKRRLLLDAFVPAKKDLQKRTAIMIIHGGGWRSGNKNQHHPLAIKLAELGYVCFTPEYRLSTEALYPAAVLDLKAALRWMHKNAGRYNIDTNRIVVSGFSAGGQLAALIGATNGLPLFESGVCHPGSSSNAKAIINMDGILAFIHPQSGEGDDSKKPSAATLWFGFAKNDRPDLWHQASALNYAGKKTPPTLFLNSSVDRMHAGRDEYIEKLRRHKIYTEVKTFHGAPHSFPLFNPWFDSTVQYIDRFLGKIFNDKKEFSQGNAAQGNNALSKVWIADNGDETYKNPVLHADYSDPDAVRVGEDYYMTASSFEDVPGLPILHSKDLVNWKLIGHALKKQVPVEHFKFPRHGEGVWAPSIRFYKGEYYIYYPDPDFGIYLVKAKHPAGPWSEPVLVEGGKGLIDPCPLWDDDGKNYLVHAFAGSRAGIKSILVVKPMNKEGTKTTGEGVMVYDGHGIDPTVEGPKFYKRGGYYYIFAPAGGVSTGWQLVLRSKHVYGPYERRVVMEQGSTAINGPHQGAWVTTSSGQDWFLHFQDKGVYGRVVHLQPMKWKDGWPVIGNDPDADGKGEPVLSFKKPAVGLKSSLQTPADSDEFNGPHLGLKWQWMANPEGAWAFVNAKKGVLTLFSYRPGDSSTNLWYTPNVLLQKFPAETFMATTKLTFKPNNLVGNERAGLTVMGLDYATIFIRNTKDGNHIVYSVCRDAGARKQEKEQLLTTAASETVYFRVNVKQGGICSFSYSLDGVSFIETGQTFSAKPGKWKGAKLGLFCTRQSATNDSGYAEVDWFRIEPLQ